MQDLRGHGSAFWGWWSAEGVIDEYARETLARLPLAEAVMRLWAFIADGKLWSLFESYRGRYWQGAASFRLIAYLAAVALMEYEGSAHRAFTRAERQGRLKDSERPLTAS